MIYQRRTLANITGSVTNNLVRPPAPGTTVVGGPQAGVIAGTPGYPRPGPAGHPASATPVMAPTAPHYPRPHFFGHDSNIMRKCLSKVLRSFKFLLIRPGHLQATQI